MFLKRVRKYPVVKEKLEKKDYCTSISLLVIFPTMLFR